MEALLDQRLTAAEARIKALEAEERSGTSRHTEILVRLERLETRVGIMAAGIGVVSGGISSIAVAAAQVVFAASGG